MTTSGIFATLLLFGSAAPADPVADEQKLIRGTWSIASCQTDGVLDTEAMKKVRYVFAGGTYQASLDGNVFEQGKIELDPRPALKQFELVKQGERHGALGIYEIDGDTLRLCFDPSGLNRPKAFDGANGNAYLVLKREPPRRKP